MWRRFLLLINAALSWVVVLHGCRKGMLLCPATSFFFRLIYWSAHGLLPVICAIWKDGYIVLYRSVASGNEIARKHWAPDIELHTHTGKGLRKRSAANHTQGTNLRCNHIFPWRVPTVLYVVGAEWCRWLRTRTIYRRATLTLQAWVISLSYYERLLFRVPDFYSLLCYFVLGCLAGQGLYSVRCHSSSIKGRVNNFQRYETWKCFIYLKLYDFCSFKI